MSRLYLFSKRRSSRSTCEHAHPGRDIVWNPCAEQLPIHSMSTVHMRNLLGWLRIGSFKRPSLTLQ